MSDLNLEKIYTSFDDWLNDPAPILAEDSGCDIYIEIAEATTPMNPSWKKYAL